MFPMLVYISHVSPIIKTSEDRNKNCFNLPGPITTTDFLSAKKSELTFAKKIVAQTFSLHQFINECSLFNITNTSVLVFNLQEEITVTENDKDLQLQKAIFKDNTDKISGVFFESAIKKISEGTCYNSTKMRVQKYQAGPVLKSA